MSDERLRQLERAFQASRSPVDRALYLRERARYRGASDAALALASRLLEGELALERLELAALAGHEAALEVVGDEVVERASFLVEGTGSVRVMLADDDVGLVELTEWAHVVESWGSLSGGVTACLLATARLVLEEASPWSFWVDEDAAPHRRAELLGNAWLLLEAAEALHACSCGPHSEAARAALAALDRFHETRIQPLFATVRLATEAALGDASSRRLTLMREDAERCGLSHGDLARSWRAALARWALGDFRREGE